MECHSSSLTVLDTWSQSTCSKQCHWTSLQCILLFNIYTPTMPAVWWNIIQLLCDHAQCSIWSKLALEYDGYESSSKNINIPTPLRRTSKIHHISSVENASFDPEPVTPHSTSTRQPHHRPAWWCLTFSSSKDEVTPTHEIPLPASTAPLQNHADTLQHPTYKCTLNAYVNLQEEEERRTFKQSP